MQIANPPAQKAPADAASGPPAKGAQALPPVPFVRASLERIMPARQWSHAVTLSASPQPLPTLQVPAHGFLRSVLLRIRINSTAGGTYTAGGDGLIRAIKSVNFADVNGSNIIVPITGYDVGLLNKYLPNGYSDPAITNPSAVEKWLRLPIEVSGRDGLGSLPNMDGASHYTADVTIAALSELFSTNPTTAPIVTVDAYAECWSPVQSSDFQGRPVSTQPPGLGTTQYVSQHRVNFPAAGTHNFSLERRGNLIRALIFVGRDGTTGLRSDSVLPTSIRFDWDGRELFEYPVALQQFLQLERAGIARETGVAVIDFNHEFDGRMGAELRDQWLRTLKSSTLDFVFEGVAAAGQLSIFTVDVAPVGNIYTS